MLLLRAQDLFAQSFVDGGIRVLRGSICVTVIHGIDAEEQIVRGQVGVDPRGAEIFADVLWRIGEGFCNPAWRAIRIKQLGTVGYRPKRKQRPDDGGSSGTRGVVGNEADCAQPQMLAVTFVVAKAEIACRDVSGRRGRRRSYYVETPGSSPGRNNCARPMRCCVEIHTRNREAYFLPML